LHLCLSPAFSIPFLLSILSVSLRLSALYSCAVVRDAGCQVNERETLGVALEVEGEEC
jgi:hypothetical protein